MSDDEDNYEVGGSDGSDSDNEGRVNKKVVPRKIGGGGGGLIRTAALYSAGGDDEEDDAGNNEDDDDEEADDDEVEDDDEEVTSQAGGAGDEDEEEPEESDDDSDIEVEGDGDEPNVQSKPVKANKGKKPTAVIDEEDDDEYDEYDENYLQKFDNEIIRNYVNSFHPECMNHNYEEIAKLSVVVKNSDGIIVDPLHRTIPYLTKYERARVLGQRAKQIETGAKPLVKVPESIVDGYIIAELELREKKIPFIIRRPIPGGGCEYWSIRDLEIVAF
jgi:DNA-directed RNA polymerase I, II, and III subunit RPABC2